MLKFRHLSLVLNYDNDSQSFNTTLFRRQYQLLVCKHMYSKQVTIDFNEQLKDHDYIHHTCFTATIYKQNFVLLTSFQFNILKSVHSLLLNLWVLANDWSSNLYSIKTLHISSLTSYNLADRFSKNYEIINHFSLRTVIIKHMFLCIEMYLPYCQEC